MCHDTNQKTPWTGKITVNKFALAWGVKPMNLDAIYHAKKGNGNILEDGRGSIPSRDGG